MKNASVRQPLSTEPSPFPLSSRQPVTFSISPCFCTSNHVFSNLHKTVILSEAPSSSTENRGFVARSRRTSATLAGRCCSKLSDRKTKKLRAKRRDLRFYGPFREMFFADPSLHALSWLNNPLTLTNRNDLIRFHLAKFLDLLRSRPLHFNQVHRRNLPQPKMKPKITL